LLLRAAALKPPFWPSPAVLVFNLDLDRDSSAKFDLDLVSEAKLDLDLDVDLDLPPARSPRTGLGYPFGCGVVGTCGSGVVLGGGQGGSVVCLHGGRVVVCC